MALTFSTKIHRLWRPRGARTVASVTTLSTETEMATRFAVRNRIRLDADALAQWLDQVGMPVMLAAAMLTMVAALAA
jgi:hypothetical protein